MGGGRGQAVGPPPGGRQRPAVARPVPFEPQHGGAEHPAPGQRLTHPRLHRPEVLADDEGAGPVRLQEQDRQHRLAVVRDVRALGGRDPLRDPPEPEQAHHVVDAQRPGMAEHPAQQRAQRRVPGLHEPIGAPRRQPPVLAARVERVGRGTDADAPGVQGRPEDVRAVRVHPDGQVVHDADRHAGLAGGLLGGGELGVRQPDQPPVEVGALLGILPRPVGAPGGVPVQRRALLGAELPVGRFPFGGARDGVQQFQGGPLEGPDGVAVDQRALLQHPAAQLAAPGGEVGEGLGVGAVRVLGDVLDPQVDGVGEAAGGRPVRGRVGRRPGHGRVQRIDLDEPGTVGAAGPAGELREVAEVAHAPGALRQQGVQLDEQPVGPLGRGRGPLGGHDQHGRPGTAVGGADVEGVHAQRREGARLPGLARLRRIPYLGMRGMRGIPGTPGLPRTRVRHLLGLQPQPCARRQRGQPGGRRRGGPPDQDGRKQAFRGRRLRRGQLGPYVVRGGGAHPQLPEHRGDRGPRDADGDALGGLVGGGDAVQSREPGEFVHGCP